MKKLIYTLLFISTVAFAQMPTVLHIHSGYFNPRDVQGGMQVGFLWGKAIDEAVDLGIGFDIFYKTYSDETKVAQDKTEGLASNTYTTEVDYSRTVMPLNFSINVKLPAGPYWGYFARGSLSYQFLFSKVKNYQEDTSENQKFGGLGWQGAAGLFYHVGSKSTVIIDAFYNNCTVSRDVNKSQVGLPIAERVDLSGIGLRVGVSLDLN